MQAVDVMTTKVITVQPHTPTQEIVELLLKYRISAVFVVDTDQHILGIVSEGDLIRRIGDDRKIRHSWWLEALLSVQDRAGEYIKTHGRSAVEVMTRDVIDIREDAPLHEIARLLEKHRIKRVPVTRDGRLIGIVSRANLLQALATKEAVKFALSSSDDQTIRTLLLKILSNDVGLDTSLINVIVRDGVVELWGSVDSSTEKTAAQIVAKNIPGVKCVENSLKVVPMWGWSY